MYTFCHCGLPLVYVFFKEKKSKNGEKRENRVVTPHLPKKIKVVLNPSQSNSAQTKRRKTK